jgi:hypothetical protein
MTTPSEANQGLLKACAEFFMTVAESQRLIDEHQRHRGGKVESKPSPLAAVPNGRRPLFPKRRPS